jgi:hypothetical protein
LPAKQDQIKGYYLDKLKTGTQNVTKPRTSNKIQSRENEEKIDDEYYTRGWGLKSRNPQVVLNIKQKTSGRKISAEQFKNK